MELLLAIALAVIVLALALPTLGSLFGGNELQEKFDKFDEFVHQAQTKAVKERRTYLIVWQEGGLTLEPQVAAAEDAEAEVPAFNTGDAKLTLERPFALEKKPLAEWPFWKSGTCEPVRVIYESKQGRWVAEYDPLTTHGTLLEMGSP